MQERMEDNRLVFVNDQILMNRVVKITTYVILNDWPTCYPN